MVDHIKQGGVLAAELKAKNPVKVFRNWAVELPTLLKS
jgi:hypothetical protein